MTKTLRARLSWKANWRIARVLVLLIASVLILAFLVRTVGVDRFLTELSRAQAPLVLACAAAYLLELGLRWVRWLVLFAHPRRGAALVIQMIGTGVNELAPSGTGELVRGVVARERYGISFARVLAPTAVERLSDLVFLLALAGYAVVAFLVPVPAIAIGVPVLLVAAGLLILARPTLLSRAAAPFHGRDGLLGRIAGFVQALTRDLAWVANRRAALATALILTAAIWVLEGLAQWFMLSALGIHLDLALVLGLTAIAFLVGFVSFLPGGLGSREAALTGLLVASGASSPAATAATVSLRVGQTLLVLLMGSGAALAAYLGHARPRLGQGTAQPSSPGVAGAWPIPVDSPDEAAETDRSVG